MPPTIALIALCLTSSAHPPEHSPERIRLVVLTDISSLTAGEKEPDDGQSLIRLMLYANEFDIEGLLASANLGHGKIVRPDLLHEVVTAYEKVEAQLKMHDPRYPSAGALRATIRGGQPVAGKTTAVSDSVGPEKDTPASRRIMEIVDRDDPRPVWVVIWGGSADLAQALWRVKQDRTPDELARFVARLRVMAIGDQDSTGPWIRERFPSLHVIVQQRAYRGMYRGGDTALTSSDWVETHVHGHGPLGDLYPNYRGGDIFPRLGPVRGIKEGDTPSFLALLPNGLTDLDHPELGSWGGCFERQGGSWIDVVDTNEPPREDPDPRMISVWRWRPAFQADFQARLDWCVKPYRQANHPPLVRLVGQRVRMARTGETLRLDATGTSDPDGQPLDYHWSIYPLSGRTIPIESSDAPQARLTVPPGTADSPIPVLLSVTDHGKPSLTRYARILVQVAR